MSEDITVVSYNRPLTREARRDLDEYGIIDEESVNEFGRWTVVTLEDEPEKDVLEYHELRVERDPETVYLTDDNERVEIYADEVFVDGYEQSISPDEAREHAEREGWERVVE